MKSSGLTAAAVEKIKPTNKRREIPDGKLTGFYLVVQPSGEKSWAVRYRNLQGKPRKYTIGRYPAFDLTKAREAGQAALRAVDEGGDPAGAKVQAKAVARQGASGADLIENVFAKFMERYAKKETRETTWRESQRIFDAEIMGKWGGRKVSEITKAEVIDLLDAIVDRGSPVMANRVLAAIRKFFNWCVNRDILAISPCAGVEAPTSEESRDRVLTDAELAALWKACDERGYPFGPMTKLLMLTGQRVSEVRKLPWSEIDLKERVWALPAKRAKNGRANDVLLSDKAIEVIKAIPRIAGAGLVFTTTGETPVSGMNNAKAAIDTALLNAVRVRDPKIKSLPHWTFHDLRRTLATGLQKLGFPVEVVEAVLNHKSGVVKGVAAIYARHDYAAEKRKALDAWARHIETIITGKKSNVVTMRPRRA